MIEKKKKNTKLQSHMLPSIKKKKKRKRIQTSVKNWHLERKEFTVTPAVTLLRFPWHRSGSIYTSFNNELSVSPCSLSAYFRGMGGGGHVGEGEGVWGGDWEPPSLHYGMIFITQNEWGRKRECVHKQNSSTKVFYVPIHKARTRSVQQRLPGKKCEWRATRPTMHRKLTVGSFREGRPINKY